MCPLSTIGPLKDWPLKSDQPAEGLDKAKKNVPLLRAEMCQIKGLKDYICYHMTNVANKYYESHEDWEQLTAKGFVHFRVNIAPTLPPDAAPSAQVTKPSPVINDPLRDWKKGIKCDMSIYKEMKKTKEWEQWDTQFRADVTTQGLSNVLDPSYVPATYDDKMLFREQQHYMYAVFIRVLKTDKGKAIVRNTRVPSTPRVFPRSLPKLSLMPTPFSSTSPLPVSVMEPGMAQRSNLSSIGWNRFNFTKNLLTPLLLCPTPSS